MKRSLSDGSGYLSIDHRDSPGLSMEDVPGALRSTIILSGKGEHLERDIQQCSHCQRGVVLNPGRVRARALCPKCHHYICDFCEDARVKSGGSCVPFKAVLDHALAIAERYDGQPDHPDAVIDPLAIAAEKAAEIRTAAPSSVLTDAGQVPP